MMGTWENLKIIKKNVMDGMSHSDVLECAMFLSEWQQLRETNFPDHAPAVFIEQKRIFFYCILHINPELCFDLRESNPNL